MKFQNLRWNRVFSKKKKIFKNTIFQNNFSAKWNNIFVSKKSHAPKTTLQNKIIYLFPKDFMLLKPDLLKPSLQMTDLQRLHHPLEELKRATGFLRVYNWRKKVTSSWVLHTCLYYTHRFSLCLQLEEQSNKFLSASYLSIIHTHTYTQKNFKRFACDLVC